MTNPNSTATATSDLLDRFSAVRNATTDFCRPLSPEDLMVQSCPEASPVKWHLAHTSWFFETFVLREFLAGYQPFHPDFLWLFNSYYNSLGDMPEKKLRASFSRPPVDAILAYRTHVDSSIASLLQYPLEDEAARRIVLGLQHEQQHLELIATDIKHALFTNPLHPALLAAPAPPSSPALAPPQDWVSFPGGLVPIGITPNPADTAAFAFDNETPRHQVFLQPFSLSTRLVTCAEYLAFLDDGGYSRPELWLSEGWITLRDQGWQAPLYWHHDSATQSGWSIDTLYGFLPLDDLSETPVCHLSFFEAEAFARWSSLTNPGHRLPTEFEWEHAASHHLPPSTAASQLDPNHLHPAPATNTSGLQQLFGELWQWTASGYTGYPGYHPLPGALGEYNGKFMSSQVVLRGSSCVTPPSHARLTYRNFFSPATRWQFSGLRLAQDATK